MWRSRPQKHHFGGTTFWFSAQLSHSVRPLMSGADTAKQTSSPTKPAVLSMFCHQETFFRALSLLHLHPLRPLPKKGSGSHWWSAKHLLCHQRLWGKNTCMICTGYVTRAVKTEWVCIIQYLREKIPPLLPETISLTESSEAGSTHHLPSLKEASIFPASRNRGCHHHTKTLLSALLAFHAACHVWRIKRKQQKVRTREWRKSPGRFQKPTVIWRSF